jgi:hypothetical protein
VWLRYGDEFRPPPEQLPIVLQVLLSQAHRLRALDLLGRFLDLGPWAVNLALSVGIFPYVLKVRRLSVKFKFSSSSFGKKESEQLGRIMKHCIVRSPRGSRSFADISDTHMKHNYFALHDWCFQPVPGLLPLLKRQRIKS